MYTKPVIEPVPVCNPRNGIWYNLSALFEMLEENEADFGGYINDLEKAGEMLPFLLESGEWNRLDIMNAADSINKLKRMFRDIRPIQ